MADRFEYKSVIIDHTKGEGYKPSDDLLNDHGADGWELVGVQHGDKLLENKMVEVFYLKRKAESA